MDEITIYSSISKELMQKTVWRGSLLAAIGALIILLAGIFMPLQQLDFWGFFLFCIAFGFITAGLLPYRRLRAVESSPYCLKMTEESLVLSRKGRQLLSIPSQAIDKISFIKKDAIYGMGIMLRKKSNAYASFATMPDCDLFFPYFSERGCRQLQ